MAKVKTTISHADLILRSGSKKRKAGHAIEEDRPTKRSPIVNTSSKKKGIAGERTSMTPSKNSKPANTLPKKNSIAGQRTITTPSRKSKPTKESSATWTLPITKKGPVINEPPTQIIDVLVFGDGRAGELGFGIGHDAMEIDQPRLNVNLSSDRAGIVQISAGSGHAVALTAHNEILTWGSNDVHALGRATALYDGLEKTNALDANSDDSSDGASPDLGLDEATPAPIDLSSIKLADGTRWARVAAGGSGSFALTDDGRVYGWGTFRCNEGVLGFTPTLDIAVTPVLIEGLKNIVDISCGAEHALALDNRGIVYAWGSGEQNQLGRRVVERNKRDALHPREVCMPRQAKGKIRTIEAGQYHCFAIATDDEVYAWGLNNFDQTGITSDTVNEERNIVATAQHVKSLAGKRVQSIAGGLHHSIAVTADGKCLAWGRVDGGQTGIPRSQLEMLDGVLKKDDRGRAFCLSVPTEVSLADGHAMTVSAGPDHSIVVTAQGRAYATGDSSSFQTGLRSRGEVLEMTLLDSAATRGRKINGVSAGGRFSIITAEVESIQ